MSVLNLDAMRLPRLGRGIARIFITAVVLLVTSLAAMPGPARASDCTLGFCGVVYNHEGRTLVAASLDKSGGDCPPFGRCGTCDVPSGSDSKRPDCARVFHDADVFTYDQTAFYVDGTRYPAHRYVKFHSW